MNENKIRGLGFNTCDLPVRISGEIDKILFGYLVEEYFKSGNKFFDVSHDYMRGTVEPTFREMVVRKYPREEFLVNERLNEKYLTTRNYVKPFIDGELSFLGLEYFDYYTYEVKDEKSYNIFNDAYAYQAIHNYIISGKIRNFGIDYYGDIELFARILNELEDISFVIIEYSGDYKKTSDLIDIAKSKGKKIMIRESFANGLSVKKLINLENESASVINFAKQNDIVEFAIVKMNTIKEIKANSSLFGKPNVPNSVKELDKINTINGSIAKTSSNSIYIKEEEVKEEKKEVLPDNYSLLMNLSVQGGQNMNNNMVPNANNSVLPNQNVDNTVLPSNILEVNVSNEPPKEGENKEDNSSELKNNILNKHESTRARLMGIIDSINNETKPKPNLGTQVPVNPSILPGQVPVNPSNVSVQPLVNQVTNQVVNNITVPQQVNSIPTNPQTNNVVTPTISNEPSGININNINKDITLNVPRADVVPKSIPVQREVTNITPPVSAPSANTQVQPIMCTNCTYCRRFCPKGIPINTLINLYNESLYNSDLDYSYRYQFAVKNVSGASACDSCGLCLNNCPMKINIPDIMHKISEKFEGVK